MKKTYTTAELAELFEVSTRTIQRHIATLRDKLSPKDNKYDSEVFNVLSAVLNHTPQRQETTDNDTYDHVEHFTNEEYQEFHKRLVEYPLFRKHIENLKSEIEHHKKQYEKLVELHNDFVQAHKSSLQIIEQRNFIDAQKMINKEENK